MTEFVLRAIISAFIFTLIWFSIVVMYFKYKLNTLKNRLERKVREIAVKISELGK